MKGEWRRSGRFNRHHIVNRVNQGRDVASNLLNLDTERHRAWHFLFRNLSFVQVAQLLIRCWEMKQKEGTNGVGVDCENRVPDSDILTDGGMQLPPDESGVGRTRVRRRRSGDAPTQNHVHRPRLRRGMRRDYDTDTVDSRVVAFSVTFSSAHRPRGDNSVCPQT